MAQVEDSVISTISGSLGLGQALDNQSCLPELLQRLMDMPNKGEGEETTGTTHIPDTTTHPRLVR